MVLDCGRYTIDPERVFIYHTDSLLSAIYHTDRPYSSKNKDLG